MPTSDIKWKENQIDSIHVQGSANIEIDKKTFVGFPSHRQNFLHKKK